MAGLEASSSQRSDTEDVRVEDMICRALGTAGRSLFFARSRLNRANERACLA